MKAYSSENSVSENRIPLRRSIKRAQTLQRGDTPVRDASDSRKIAAEDEKVMQETGPVKTDVLSGDIRPDTPVSSQGNIDAKVAGQLQPFEQTVIIYDKSKKSILSTVFQIIATVVILVGISFLAAYLINKFLI